MTISAKVIEDSISVEGKRLVTMQLTYPRFIHAEFMTHRVFSRNASSSRAIPVAKMLDAVRREPAMPIHWGKNQAGMQANEEHNALVPLHESVVGLCSVQEAWREAAHAAAYIAEAMSEAGYHKQVVNRVLEPFQHIHVVVTATEWSNFFSLRDHPDAQPEIRELAKQMKLAMYTSAPVIRKRNRMISSSWHLPYVTQAERVRWFDSPEYLAKLSAARCARVSYLTHDGASPDPDKDLDLYMRLVGGKPIHASPIEHQAYPLPLATQRSNNFVGWRQFRETVEVSFH